MKFQFRLSSFELKRIESLDSLGKLCSPVSQDVKEAAYKRPARPVLDYGGSVSDPHTLELQDELEKVQNRAARFG